MMPASSRILDTKTVMATLTGPKTMVLKLSGHNISILHGEIMGLIMGYIIPNCRDDFSVDLYTDHLNTVRFLQDVHSNIDQDPYLRY